MTDYLISIVYQQIHPELIKVTVCGDTVRVTRHDLPGAYIQGELPHWWRVYVDGDYLCGMETVLDAFRAIQLIREIQGVNNHV